MPQVIGIIVYLIVMALCWGISIAQYVLHSMALYKISKKRNLKNSFLAWIPVASYWTLGNIADDIDGDRNLKSKFRKVLLTLGIILIGAAILFFIVFFVLMAVAAMASVNGYMPETTSITVAIIMYAVLIPLAFASMATEVIMYLCYFKIYEGILPEKRIKYFLLSMLVPLALPICLYKTSKACPDKVAQVVLENQPESTQTPEETTPEETTPEETTEE